MGISTIIELAGGLGAFLFGMEYMGDGLQLAAGPKMKDLLEKLTRNPILGFLLGTVVTLVIQSSSATTVMVMGFINAGIMDLAQATGVIMGANIGTTITSILIALDVSAIAPVCIAVGALMMLYAKRKHTKYIGQVILGFGLLFEGLHVMSSAMEPLKDSAFFQNLIVNANNPWLGLLIGTIFCALIQSSSAAVGIIQTLAFQGLMPLQFGAYLVCGINIGSSSPPMISALNARNNAKRAAWIYLIFNVIGAILFMPLTMFTPLTTWIAALIPNPAFQIATYHILFKVITGLLLLPCVNWVVKLTYRIVPIKEHESAFRLMFIDKNLNGSPAVITLQIKREVQRMADLVRDNLIDSIEGLVHHDMSKAQRIRQNEEVIDYLTAEISAYLTQINAWELPDTVSAFLGSVFGAINDLEQIGDHAVKILDQNERNIDINQFYTDDACAELLDIYHADLDLLDECIQHFLEESTTLEQWYDIRKKERRIHRMVSSSQTKHMDRLRTKACHTEPGLTFLEALNSMYRVVNHASNIAESTMSVEEKEKIVNLYES